MTSHTCPSCGGSGKKKVKFKTYLGPGRWDHSTMTIKCPVCRGTGELEADEFELALEGQRVIDMTDFDEDAFRAWFIE